MKPLAAGTAAASVVLLSFLSANIVFGDGPIKHGATYRIRSGFDGGFLTAKYPKFSEDLTIKLGKAVTEEWEGDPGQIWDAIIWPQRDGMSAGENIENLGISKGLSAGKIFWLHPKGAALNELTGFRMNSSHLLQFIEIADTSGTYLIKNIGNEKCLRSQGIDKEIVFETCEELKTSQQWDLEEFFEDRSAVDKTFTFNYSTMSSSQQEIKHVCKKVCHLAVVKV